MHSLIKLKNSIYFSCYAWQVSREKGTRTPRIYDSCMKQQNCVNKLDLSFSFFSSLSFLLSKFLRSQQKKEFVCILYLKTEKNRIKHYLICLILLGFFCLFILFHANIINFFSAIIVKKVFCLYFFLTHSHIQTITKKNDWRDNFTWKRVFFIHVTCQNIT